MKFNFVFVISEPAFAFVVEPVAGSVVHYEKHLLLCPTFHDLHEKLMEGVSVEHVGKAVVEVRVVQPDRAEHVRRLA